MVWKNLNELCVQSDRYPLNNMWVRWEVWSILSRIPLHVWTQWRRQWHPTPVLLPGKSHGRRGLVGCSPWGREELDTTERIHFHFSLSCTGEGNGNPLQCSCLENPRDGGAWWAAVSGVAQSRTRLKWLSSSEPRRVVCFQHTMLGQAPQHSPLRSEDEGRRSSDSPGRVRRVAQQIHLPDSRVTPSGLALCLLGRWRGGRAGQLPSGLLKCRWWPPSCETEEAALELFCVAQKAVQQK